jgi:hypothetical protein
MMAGGARGMSGHAIVGAAVAATLLLLGTSPAQAQRRTQAGVLTCSMGPSIGALIGSRQRIDCRFVPGGGKRPETYSGTITRFGLDIGVVAGGAMRWSVFTRRKGLGRGSLAGHYVGVSGDVSVGLGIGANALIGGSRRSVVLQPVSTVIQAGLNLAFGVAGLTLRFSGYSADGP